MKRGDIPCPLEDLRDDKHGHVTADAITLTRDPSQLAEHGLLQIRIPIVQLQSIGPAREVGVAPIGKDAAFAGDIPVGRVFWLRGKLFLGPADEEVRMLLDPGMIRRHVVRDKIEDQPQTTLAQPFSQPGKSLIPAEIGVDMIVMDRGNRNRKCLSPEGPSGRCSIFSKKLRDRGRYTSAGFPGLPYAQEPDKVEPVRGKLIELRIGNIVQSSRAVERGRNSDRRHGC